MRKAHYFKKDGYWYDSNHFENGEEIEPSKSVNITHKVLLESNLELFTVEEVAVALRVTDVTIRKLIQTDELPAIKIGGTYRISRSTLEEIFN